MEDRNNDDLNESNEDNVDATELKEGLDEKEKSVSKSNVLNCSLFFECEV